ncbi:MAG: hypothetical protein NW201_02780 [Gemmatimonadales bacterium]|nr:hypothetical protein [Gemmatimonadales bacterium]
MRTLFGFAVFAVVAMLALRIIMGVLGGLLGILITVAVWAFWGWLIYLGLKVIAPETAARIREMVSGKASETSV